MIRQPLRTRYASPSPREHVISITVLAQLHQRSIHCLFARLRDHKDEATSLLFLFPLQNSGKRGKFNRHSGCAQPSTIIRKHAKKLVEVLSFNVTKAMQENHTKAMHKLWHDPQYALSQLSIRVSKSAFVH